MKHFVFLDDSNPPRPFLCAKWGPGYWIFQLHPHSKEWVSMKKISTADMEELQKRALPDAERAKYPGLK